MLNILLVPLIIISEVLAFKVEPCKKVTFPAEFHVHEFAFKVAPLTKLAFPATFHVLVPAFISTVPV